MTKVPKVLVTVRPAMVRLECAWPLIHTVAGSAWAASWTWVPAGIVSVGSISGGTKPWRRPGQRTVKRVTSERAPR